MAHPCGVEHLRFLWLCLHLSDLALEIYSRAAPTPEPLVVSDGQGREQRVLAANAAARARGILPGLAVSAAHALAPRLYVKPRNAVAEAAMLERLAAWAYRYTSQVSLAAPDALLLEVAGSSTFFGGLAPLRARIEADIDGLGFRIASAIAPTPLAATWLARCGVGAAVTETRALFGALAPLPLACLALDAKREALLSGMGLACLADCLRLPRDGLARRVGPEVLQALDRAFGRLPDVRVPYAPPAEFHARLALPAPVDAVEPLLFPLQRLLRELSALLGAHAAGVQRFTLTLHHAKAQTTSIDFTFTAPARDAEHWLGLARERLQRRALAQPVEEVELAAREFEPLGSHTGDFFAGARLPEAARAQLIDRLRARLGDAAICGLDRLADHRPEHAWRFLDPGQAPTCAEVPQGGERPLWLLPEPVPLAARAGRPWLGGDLRLHDECERIESGWWDGGDVARDYFIARDATGSRYWIFRERGAEPRWFLHGIFS